MKRIFTLMVMLCFFLQHSAKAQINGQQPGTALSICDASSLSIGTVPGYNGGGLPNSCLAAGALNPYWYTFTVTSSGTIGFTITPNNGNDDYDFAVYDITNTQPSNAANAPLVSCNYSGYTGTTGCTAGGSGSFNSANGSNQNQLINVTAGQTFALIVSHYTSSNQSGYDLQFTGGSVTPSPLPPALDTAYVSNCNEKLNVTFNQSVQCSSIASNGSDFYLMPGNIAISAAAGVGCGTTTFTNQAVLTLPNNIAVGNYTLHVKVGSDANTVTDVCGNNIPTTSIAAFTVSPAPQPNVTFAITTANTQCLYNNNFDFNNTSTVASGTISSYAWEFGDNGTANFTSGSHAYGTAGNYTVELTATTNQGCIDSVKHTLVVLSSPGAPAKVSPVNYCLGQTPVAVSATPSSGSTINWYANPTGGPAGTTAPTPSTTVAGTYTFYVSQTLTATGCEGPRDSIKVIVKPLPATLTANSNSPVCSKDTVKLTGNSSDAGVTYAWTGPNGYTSTLQNPTVDSATMAAGGVYKVVVTLNGCKDSVATVVTMKQTPYNLTASSNTPVCSDALNVLHLLSGSSNPAATYSWAGPNGYTSSVQNPNISPVSVSMAGTYMATVSANGCSDTVSTVVAVNQTPVGLTASNSGPVCSGPTKSIQLFANTTTTGTPTYSWAGPNGYTSNQQNPTITGLTVANSGKYICTVTLGTCSDTVSTTVTIKQTPVSLVATSNSPLCSGAATNITLNATTTTTGTITYAWSGPNTFTSAIQNPTINGATVAMIGRYIATVTLNGCSDTVGVNVAIGQTPVGLTASSNSPVCSGPNGTVTLLANTSTPGAVTYSWSGPNSYTSASQNPSITNAAVAMSGKYTATVTLNGCSDTVSTIVTVKQTPVGLTASSNSPICSGANNNINLQSATTTTGATFSWAGPNAYTDNAQNPVINAAAANMTGKYIATVTLNGCSDTVSTMVTVNQTPAAPTSVDTVWYCNNGTATALTATGTSLKWYTAIGGTASATAPVPSTATVGATTYYVTQTSVAGCEGPVDSIIVMVKPNPARPTVTTPVAYCLNDVPVALIAAAATGGTLNWYTAIGGTGFGTAPIPSTATVNTYKWYVSQTVNGCEGKVDSIQVTVKPLPVPPVVGSNTPVCSGTGNTLNLTASSTSTGVTYAWTGPNNYTSSTQNPSISAPTTAATGNYVVTVTLNGCIKKDSVAVLINPTPVAPTVVPTVAYCQYLPTTILSATPVTGNVLKWYTSSTSTTPLAGAPTPSSQVPGTFTWYVSQTSPQGCEGPRASIAVTIKPKPTLPGVAPLYTYCQFESVPALTANGQNLLWYSGLTGGLGDPNAPIPSTLVPTTTTFFVSQTINGCEGDRDSIKVTVLPKPAPPVVVTPISYCQYSTAQPVTATGTGLKWYAAPTGGAGATVAPVPNTGYEDTISYWVTQTVNGCESDRMRLDVIVNYQPNGIITATSANICQYSLDTFNYFGNARPDAVYDWTSLFQKSTLMSGSGQGPVVVRFDSVGSITVRMRVDNKGCLSPEAAFTVNVSPAPVVRITSKAEACENEAVVVAMNYASIPVTKFTWGLDGGQIQYGADAGPLGVIWKTPGKHVVTLVATTDSKCQSLPTIDTVMVHPLPDARILGASATDVCSGDSVLLRGSLPDSGTVMTWSPVTQFGGMTEPDSQNVYAKVITSGSIKLTATNEFGCKASDSIMITAKPCCQIYFPDAFTPNKDGKNDLFRPITIGHHEISSFRVVNRYGQVVFETADEERGWDGSFGGVDQPIGTYYYYIKYKCDGKYIEEKGEITLVR
ncbi:Ig-like domain-containing protein [Taibaiella soli]|uniref:PKD domain-containing protein n=1 Tax=Taibaiella soli TaxID=1649169 RepID=A0A2W2AH75_9BACT|nr:PKD domain-containing protein [Taibaiella soli]PZF74845.1 hypothetical protein DN068_01210 [Taibaiella soli]